MTQPKTTYAEAEEIIRLYDDGNGSYIQAELAELYGYASPVSISNIVHGDRRVKPDERPVEMAGWDPCILCEMLTDAEDGICRACKRDLARGIVYENVSEELVRRYGRCDEY